MKRILGLCLVMGLGLGGCASMTGMTQTTKPMPEVTEVIVVDGKSKDQIFDASKIWIAKSFKSANNVVQYEDKASGTIIGKGNIKFPCYDFTSCGAFGNDRVNFTVKIDSKDNKARISFSDINRTSLTYTQGGFNHNIGKEIPIIIIEHQQAITKSLKSVVDQYKADINQQQNNAEW